MIVFGFRILRGCYRDIKEETFFIGYSGMGCAGINCIYGPMVLHESVGVFSPEAIS